MPKVSVIVPVYNSGKYLNKCISSILEQSFEDFELILIDDGSQDDSYDICANYKKSDKRIKLLKQENSGRGSARNNGIKNAEGEYILFVDADDYIDSDTLKGTVAAAVDSNADLILFDLKAVDENSEELYTINAGLPSGTLCFKEKNRELLVSTPSPCNKLIKRTLFNGDTYFPENLWYEDLVAISKLYSFVETFFYIPIAYYSYLVHDDSAVRNNDSEKTVENRINAVNDIYDYYKNKGLLIKYKQEINWIMFYHGFFLPAREIIHFDDYDKAYIKKLRDNYVFRTGGKYKDNGYYMSLSKKEKTTANALYNNMASVLNKILKIKD